MRPSHHAFPFLAMDDLERISTRSEERGAMQRWGGRLPADLLERIEAWRRKQPAPPSKTQALIYLLERGLASLD